MTRRVRTLIVDDSPRDAERLVRELEQSGFTVDHKRVQTAEDMGTALASAQWDCVLCEYRMPGFHASAALDVLRASGADLPFIIVSGTIGEETVADALKAGVHDFVAKGRPARLVQVIERGRLEAQQRRDRRRAEEALRVSEAQYRSLVDHAVFGIYRSTAEGRLLTLNPSLVTMLGYDAPEELIGVDLSSLFVERDVWEAFQRESREQGVLSGCEAVWRRKTAEHIRVRLSGRLTEDPSAGRVFQVIAEDITERHRLQEQLRQAQKMEAVGQLAGGIAHDFNNVLTAILGYSELLTDQIGPDKPIGRDLREIRVAAERAAALTRQLLAFSRKQVLAVEPIDLSTMVRNLEPMLRRLLPESIRIETGLAQTLDPVIADATQLEHLLINLSVNSRDAMPDGGTLTITTGNTTIDRAFMQMHPGAVQGSYATLAVIDTGTGMTPQVQRRIFEPFFTTKERGRGTGLGLAAVYGTVKQLGGYIAVDSEVGRGTTFRIYFPRTTRPTVKAEAPVAITTSVGAETVLLVEDERGVRAFAKAALQRFGYRVVEADSAEAALDLLKDFASPIHLLLTDVVLPGIDGRELAKRVRQAKPDARVLFMSGYPSALRTADGFLLPGVQILEKPFTGHLLLSKTRELLGVGAAHR